MREMKDSGIEWVGKVPKHWKCCKQKYGLTLLNGRAFKESEFLEDGKYKVLRVGNLFTNPIWHYSNLMLEDNKYCQKGDLLYSWSMSYAPFIWSGDKVIYHYHIWKVLIDDILCKKFVYYYLLALTEALYAEIHETTMGFITMGIMNNSYLPYCNLEEQQQIANFLDTQCSEIDATAEDIQKEIALLEEYKKSVITEAVTKGLNPDAEMKDSGIEWLGKVPTNWNFSRVLYNIKFEGGSQPPLTEFVGDYREGYIRLIQNRDYKTDAYKVYVPKKSVSKFCDEEDIMVGRYGPPLFVIHKGLKGAYNVALMKAVPIGINKQFMYYFLHNSTMLNYIESFSKRTAGQSGVNPEILKKYPMFLPNFSEQQQIADYLDTQCSEIDTLIADKKRQLDILADCKKSLIYEYVTGKKEVPVKDF
ncbi:restriction endonuclease subunit S [Phascolarctobacterium succinatutens]|uniref:restriction endonuclease subunit S n=1 Tax=Phascolarctobacterium succinatutens TaxID=626940 RepID=UPI00307A7C67